MARSTRLIGERAGRRFRDQRHNLFLSRIQPQPDEWILDVGGTPNYWSARGAMANPLLISNVNFSSQSKPSSRWPLVISDARRLPFRELTFGIVFSNSVIEHVGSSEDQRSFASEVRRIGHKLWIQTPARSCPIEPHYLGLLTHWFPRNIERRLIRWTSVWGLTTRPDRCSIDAMIGGTRLLTRREMVELFPDCQIRTERFFWILPKSYIAVRT